MIDIINVVTLACSSVAARKASSSVIWASANGRIIGSSPQSAQGTQSRAQFRTAAAGR
jgi:hypothetical protein